MQCERQPPQSRPVGGQAPASACQLEDLLACELAVRSPQPAGRAVKRQGRPFRVIGIVIAQHPRHLLEQAEVSETPRGWPGSLLDRSDLGRA